MPWSQPVSFRPSAAIGLCATLEIGVYRLFGITCFRGKSSIDLVQVVSVGCEPPVGR